MRQIVSLIKDNQAHYALVDEDDGSIIPFADLLIPDPDRFGLHESAVLGTNLIQALGLNGAKRPKTAAISLANIPPTHRQPEAEPQALSPAPPNETARERRLRKQREAYHANKANRKVPDRGKGGANRYVTIDEVLAVINQYPEGIRVRDVAQRIWRTTDGQDGSPMPGWFYTSVSNRLTAARVRLKSKGIPLPFREEDREIPDKDGKFRGNMGKFLHPLSPPSTTVPPPPLPGWT